MRQTEKQKLGMRSQGYTRIIGRMAAFGLDNKIERWARASGEGCVCRNLSEH